jgi:hypothetical protein
MMKKFVLKVSAFLLIGLILIAPFIIAYFVFDPFKVLNSYSDYSYSYTSLNRDNVSTEMFKRNKDICGYNSFIFGSSRTLAFHPSSWKKYLDGKDSPFMFVASSESVYGMYTKLRYLDSIHCKLDNVLILLCRDCSFQSAKNPTEHLFIHHPATTGESNIAYHMTFLKAYLTPDFLIRYYTYMLSGKYYQWMKDNIENRKIIYDTITNELNILDQEYAITNNPQKYYAEREEVFNDRNKEESVDSIGRIDKEQVFMLEGIESILRKNKTRYKIVISPLYEQVKLNKQDWQVLQSVFKNNVYDFSGKNSFTESRFNYYEAAHYRPLVGDSIFSIIYK